MIDGLPVTLPLWEISDELMIVRTRLDNHRVARTHIIASPGDLRELHLNQEVRVDVHLATNQPVEVVLAHRL